MHLAIIQHFTKPSTPSGVAKVDNVLGRFQEMQAELAEGRAEIHDLAERKLSRVSQLKKELATLEAKADEAASLEAGLRALTNGHSVDIPVSDR